MNAQLACIHLLCIDPHKEANKWTLPYLQETTLHGFYFTLVHAHKSTESCYQYLVVYQGTVTQVIKADSTLLDQEEAWNIQYTILVHSR